MFQCNQYTLSALQFSGISFMMLHLMHALASFQCVAIEKDYVSIKWIFSNDRQQLRVVQCLKMDLCVNIAFIFLLSLFVHIFHRLRDALPEKRELKQTTMSTNVAMIRTSRDSVSNEIPCIWTPVNDYVRISRKCMQCRHAVTNVSKSTTLFQVWCMAAMSEKS